MNSTTLAADIPVAGRIPGNRAMWVGIYCELVEFALMFLVYFFARAHHPEAFVDGPQQLSTVAGVAITLVMVSSGYCVARAVHALRADRVRQGLYWQVAALLTGLAYPVIKVFEVQWNLANGVVGQGDVFQMAYYYLTLNHLVHVTWGLLGLGWVMFRTVNGAYSARDHAGLEAFACYWHATDLIWLMIFPLFYVLS